MKKFASVIVVVVALVLCFTLAACGNMYVSNYNAKLMASNNSDHDAFVSFDSYSGTYVIKFTSYGSDSACISYNATLEEGNIKVYYDYNGEKLDLFEIGANGSVKGKTEAFVGNKTIYVIIESDGVCNVGSFSFALEK